MTRPVGPAVDTTPRPVPARTRLRGSHVELEPLHVRHAPDLFRAAQAGTGSGDESWDYLSYGPFAGEADLARQAAEMASALDSVAYAVRPVASGVAAGWLTLMDIQPRAATIELGNIWFGPALQRTRAATEAMFLALRLAAEDLGYRRLTWKCNALNAPSRRAAERLGFVFEGVLRANMVVKGRLRDTAYYSLVGEEWPPVRDAILTWLSPENATPEGATQRGLAEIRQAQGRRP